MGFINRIVLQNIALVLLALVGCGQSKNDAATSEPTAAGQSGQVVIGATPNPVPAGKGFGSTTITWDTGDRSFGQIYVSQSGKPDSKMFAQGAKGSKSVNWIKAGHSYEFRLYAGEDRKSLLAKVVVTRPAQ